MSGKIHLFTDASAAPHPSAHGGFAVIWEYDTLVMGGEMGNTTITRLEGLAVVAAMSLAHTMFNGEQVEIHTDAMVWVHRYKQLEFLAKHHWRLPKGKLVKEVDILTSMWECYASWIEVSWVKSHARIPGNVCADKAARESRQLITNIYLNNERSAPI